MQNTYTEIKSTQKIMSQSCLTADITSKIFHPWFVTSYSVINSGRLLKKCLNDIGANQKVETLNKMIIKTFILKHV